MEEEKKSGGWFKGVLLIGICLVVFISVVGNQEPSEEDKAMSTPEDSLKYYAETVYHYTHQEQGVNATTLLQLLPKDDRSWFDKNYKDCISDPFGLSGGLDPVVSGYTERNAALMNLVGAGPSRKDMEILDKKIGDKKAVFIVRQPIPKSPGETEQRYSNYTVEVIKVGSIWRVKGFGGGRELYERR